MILLFVVSKFNIFFAINIVVVSNIAINIAKKKNYKIIAIILNEPLNLHINCVIDGAVDVLHTPQVLGQFTSS